MLNCRSWTLRLACLALAGTSLGPVAVGPAVAASPDQFRARTTADMVALCAADPSSENYVAAIHFCHGFAAGAYQYYLSLAAASEQSRFVCMPDPPPSRTEAIAEFVAWAKQHPDYMSQTPVDTMFRYLGGRYPCPQ